MMLMEHQAKGYPDIFTREFLRFANSPSAHNSYKGCPVYGLFDFDPDGLAIMSTYKHGSIKMDHERARLNCPNMNWIGIKSTEIVASDDAHQAQGLLRLSGRDRRVANRMLGRRPMDEEGKEPFWRREMQVMLMLNIKVEIQYLESQERGLGGWLESLRLG
jgi:meiotic recombination protein SPO11